MKTFKVQMTIKTNSDKEELEDDFQDLEIYEHKIEEIKIEETKCSQVTQSGFGVQQEPKQSQ